ncbi:MAG: SET domain-containing protein-lysine N-methyltransferase [Chitinophagaceae bacterium]|mgnify:CR=1 FL=1|nr:SET domain-containing protein-lysine N-methyltransferase [Chitinophagaceae bacterium]
MILPGLYIAETDQMGKGVFTTENLEADSVIEIAPVLVMSNDERKLLDQTLLHDYIFEWGEESTECCLALGYVSIYNHSYESNCEYEMDFENKLIRIKTVRQVLAGEELFINYNGNWNNPKRVWFDTK